MYTHTHIHTYAHTQTHTTNMQFLINTLRISHLLS
uniref:Uncharacterized protein n=1 Tax=Anguilla anguilla TaxID=7936 RepID=A0A0E9RL87_ANGAN